MGISNSYSGTISGLKIHKYSAIKGGYSFHVCSPGCTQHTTNGDFDWFAALTGKNNSVGILPNTSLGINAFQGAIGGHNNIAIGYNSFVDRGIASSNYTFIVGTSNIISGYSSIGHCCKNKDCREHSYCAGFKDRKRAMITEKYKEPDIIDGYGVKKWLNRYGDVIKTEIKEIAYGTVTGGYSSVNIISGSFSSFTGSGIGVTGTANISHLLGTKNGFGY